MDRSPASLDTFDMPNSFDFVAQQSATVFPAAAINSKAALPARAKRGSSRRIVWTCRKGRHQFRPSTPRKACLRTPSLTSGRPWRRRRRRPFPRYHPQQPRQRSPRAAECAEFKPAQKSDETRGKYKCGRCGQIKVNHDRPFAPAQPRNADAQTDDPRRPVPTNDRDKYVAVTPKVDAMTDDELTPRPAPSADGDHSFRERTVKVGPLCPPSPLRKRTVL